MYPLVALCKHRKDKRPIFFSFDYLNFQDTRNISSPPPPNVVPILIIYIFQDIRKPNKRLINNHYSIHILFNTHIIQYIHYSIHTLFNTYTLLSKLIGICQIAAIKTYAQILECWICSTKHLETGGTKTQVKWTWRPNKPKNHG